MAEFNSFLWLNIANYKSNANQNNQVSPHTCQMTSIKKSPNNKSWKDVEKRELSYTVGGNVSLYSHYGEQYGGSSN